MLVKVSAKIFYNALINLFLNIPKSVCFRTVFYVPTLVYQFLTEITLSPCTLSICFFKVITTPKGKITMAALFPLHTDGRKI